MRQRAFSRWMNFDSALLSALPKRVKSRAAIFLAKVTTTIKLKFVDLNQSKAELFAQMTEENTKNG